MKKWRTVILPLFLAGTLGAVYLLPKAGKTAASAVAMNLPARSGTWNFKAQPPSPEELKILASDTRFSKATCWSPRPGEYNQFGEALPDVIQLSIVLSGVDINNSIHRPERCMIAQGHAITSSTDRSLALPNGRHLPVKRLASIQQAKNTPDRFNCITYYFFVGHDRATSSHLNRVFIDMKDRIVHGLDQRWAYTSVSMWYGKNVPWLDGREITEADADAKLGKFLAEFAERQIDWDQVLP